MSGLIKYISESGNGNGDESLHWNRADLDGLPFKGSAQSLGMITEQEAESRLERAADAHNGIFRLWRKKENAAYLQVLDKAANGWFQITNIERVQVKRKRVRPDGTSTIDVNFKVYVEWLQFYMIDGKPLQAQRPYQGRPND